jgi:hypothetical protein
MQSHDAMQAARLAVLEGAVLALLRGAQEDGLDGLTIEVSADDGQVVIDLQYTANGVPVTGESL